MHPAPHCMSHRFKNQSCLSSSTRKIHSSTTDAVIFLTRWSTGNLNCIWSPTSYNVPQHPPNLFSLSYNIYFCSYVVFFIAIHCAYMLFTSQLEAYSVAFQKSDGFSLRKSSRYLHRKHSFYWAQIIIFWEENLWLEPTRFSSDEMGSSSLAITCSNYN